MEEYSTERAIGASVFLFNSKYVFCDLAGEKKVIKIFTNTKERFFPFLNYSNLKKKNNNNK